MTIRIDRIERRDRDGYYSWFIRVKDLLGSRSRIVSLRVSFA